MFQTQPFELRRKALNALSELPGYRSLPPSNELSIRPRTTVSETHRTVRWSPQSAPSRERIKGCSRKLVLLALVSVTLVVSQSASAADFDVAQMLYLSGRYDQAAEMASEQVQRGIWNEKWPRLLIRCQMARGRYADALQTYRGAMRRFSSSLTLRQMGIDVLRANGLHEQASTARAEIAAQLQRSRSRYASKDELIAMGRYYADRGEDARKVLQLFFDRVRESDPNFLEAYIATAELALEKGDYQVAADTLADAESVDGSDPRVFYLMARAWAPSDSKRATAALERALKLNPRHVDSLLLQVDHAIDRELYEEADDLLTEVLSINLHEPRAWAYRGVLAHLRGNYEIEKLMRAAALSTWSQNPEVDHLIGKKLSDKYRFEEGNEYQQKAIAFDPTHRRANFQLAQDMLRLGNDKVGWELAKWVSEQDPYNVVAHNLVTLHERIREFEVLEANGIHVRMEKREAEIYGDAVLQLLTEAKEVLFDKYAVSTDQPIVVELFPDQKDFAIRTFGLPGGAGFLGVCFGRVITANSPASQGERPTNWESVLWHEFCHVVTLGKTNNRMPRWLSEGISVYEERQRDPSWGEQMTPQYRRMILSDDLTPVSRLSGAFLNPKSPLHLQFAYFESSLVVEYLIEQHGIETLKRILVELGDGVTINDALARSVGSIAKLDSKFAEFAERQAREFGDGLEWSREGFPEEPTPGAIVAWAGDHPNNFWGLQAAAAVHLQAKEFDAAAEKLEQIRDAGAISGERGGTLEKLATVYQSLEDQEREEAVCKQWVERSSDALPGLVRLIEFARQRQDWEAIFGYANKISAVNPLLPKVYAWLAESAERLGKPQVAADALESMISLEPIDLAGAHFRLAKALHELGDDSVAKRKVLIALEDAPRYRAALKLLLQLERQSSSSDEVAGAGAAAKGQPSVVEINDESQQAAGGEQETAVNRAERDGDGNSSEQESGSNGPAPSADVKVVDEEVTP